MDNEYEVQMELEQPLAEVIAVKGEKGETGDDGVSPTVEVSKVEKTTTITITDAIGAHVATINDGEDGEGVVKPVDFFTAGDSVSGTGSNMTIENTIPAALKSVQIDGDTYQQTYSGKNLIDNTDVTYDFSNVSSSDNHLSTLPTGIRYRTTYSGSGSPIVTFKLPIDLTQYIGKVVRMKATFGDKGGIRIAKVDETLSTRHIVADGSTSGETISWTVPNDLGDVKWLAYSLAIVESGGEVTVDFTDLIMTIDNSDMNYEPYVGGIPAPNPDYPQDIQVVTGEQTVEVSENLFDGTYVKYALGRTSGYQWFSSPTARSAVIPCQPNTTYKITKLDASNRFAIADCPSYPIASDTETNGLFLSNNVRMATVTTHADAKYLLVYVSIDNTEPRLQVEKNPSQSYTIDLGSTELCKIGTYQDYIYKNGDDWYLHKETGGQDITSIFSLYSSAEEGYIGGIKNVSDMKANSRNNGFCDKLTPIYSPSGAVTEGITFGAGTTNQNIYIILQSSRIPNNTIEEWNTYLSGNPFTVYYPLATATDTKITDSTLIGQLEALAAAKLVDGQTNIIVTATSSANLPAQLEVTGYRRSLAGLIAALM